MPRENTGDRPVFRDFFKECRLRADLSRKELAERLGIKEKEVIRWEKGQSLPSEHELARIAENFHLQLQFYIKMRRMVRFRGHGAEKRS